MIAKCFLVEPFVCTQDSSVADATKKLVEKDQRHIYVVDADSKPVGILSTTDILKKVAEAQDLDNMKVQDIMTKEILVYDDNDDARKAYKDMNEKGVISCAVTQEGKIVGILTLKETVRYMTDPKNL